MTTRPLHTLLALLLATLTASCSLAGEKPTKLRAVATVGMLTDAVRKIGGDRVEVTGLMGEGVDPHLYKASPGDLRLLSQADIVFGVGLHLEGRMVDALEKLGRTRRVVLIGESLPHDSLRLLGGDTHDPHIWFDVSLWSKALDAAEAGLIAADPSGADTYKKNAAAYKAELATLHDWVKAQIARIPQPQRVLVTAHDAFGYFSRAYSIEVLAIQGVSTDSEASLRDINALVDTLVARKIPAVFVESSVPRKTIDALREGAASKGHPISVGGELFSDAMGKDGTDEGTYIGMVKHNVNAIVHALAPNAPEATPSPTTPAPSSTPAAK
ncbi:MAG: zinc ABC transporter substrate-binding protein [Phycisphaerales bacterium]|nr:zinc ABC transporter substrate-binding protein [Phycisphaerales bacterium]